MKLSEDFISELKYKSDLSQIASGYMQLKRRGKNLVGLCPFHGEKTPSFNIYTENGSFYCFGCGVGGDVITFIMKIENLDYIEAVKFLAQRAGMSMPENEYDDSLSKLKTRVYEANRIAARYFYTNLYSPQGAQALSYLHSRALSDATIRRFGLGYSLPGRFSLCDYLKKEGFSNTELVSANLAFKSRSGNGIVDRFSDRVMFPIIDLRSNVIAFGGRVMGDQKPKYLNTSDTLVFKKSENLFSLYNAKNSGEKSLILCEGYMDVIAVNQAGFTNAVATLGTALTDEQAVLMKRYCDEVIICYDADEPGQKATARAIEILRRAGLTIRVLTIPNGKDPDEFIRNNGDKGSAAFKNILENSGNDVEYRLNKLRAKYNINTTEGKFSYLSEAVRMLSLLDTAMEQELYASKLAADAGIEKSSVMEQVKKASRQKQYSQRKAEFDKVRTSITSRDDKINPDRAKMRRGAVAEENLIAFLVNNPDSLSSIEKRLSPERFVTEFNRKLYEYFSKRIKAQLQPMTAVSADFSGDEISRIIRIVSSYAPQTATKEALTEYIDIINEESSKPTDSQIASASNEQLENILKMIKEKHQ